MQGGYTKHAMVDQNDQEQNLSMLKQTQSFTKLGQNHARIKDHNPKHVKAKTWHYKACMLNKHGVPKPTKNRAIL